MMNGIIHINAAPLWESPPIQRGSVARRFWRYQHRLNRFTNLARRYEQAKGRKMLMSESLWIGGLVWDTMEHCEALGYRNEEHPETGQPQWHRPDGSRVEWLNS